MSEIEFMEPPPTTAGNSKHRWHAIAEQLRQSPGDWARVRQGASNPGDAISIKTGRLSAFRPAGSFEATTRTNGDGTSDIYARYVGEAAS